MMSELKTQGITDFFRFFFWHLITGITVTLHFDFTVYSLLLITNLIYIIVQ